MKIFFCNFIPICFFLFCNFSGVRNHPKLAQIKESAKYISETSSREIQKSELDLYMESYGLVSVGLLDSSIKIDLKYSTKDNFTKTVLYDNLTQAYLHPLAGDKLTKAQVLLKQINPGLSLLIYDAARPVSVQKKMYDLVKNTRYHLYVANPSRTGLHNYGMAVDLTICNSAGIPLDMGTNFDHFGKAAGINQEDELKKQGVLTKQQIDNRKLLRQVMTRVGFQTIRGEWWHFNAVSLAEARRITNVIN